jgi:hypothetical protein
MAMIPSSFTRLQPSSPDLRVEPDLLGTTVTPRRPPNRQPAPRSQSLLLLSREPEDARLTGGTRSLDRRLLALNLTGSLATLRKPELVKPGPAPERPTPPLRAAVA